MNKKLLLFVCFLMAINFLQAQTVEEMTADKEAKEKELAILEAQQKEVTGKVDGLKGEIAALTEKITPYPRWEKGAFGTLGFSLAAFNDWLSKDAPSTSAATIGVTFNAFANMQQKKYFWRNSANINLGWIKFDNKDIDTDDPDYQVSADAFNFTSLLGFKLSEKFAISSMIEYRTAMLDGRFNDPGYLDLGAGITWTPAKDLVVVVHPLNYNFVFSDQEFNYESSLGAKVLVDYTKQVTKGISWKSNLSAFVSYQDSSNLSNWTWVNGFSTAYKGIGIGLEVGLRNNKQESKALELTDNPLQTYYVIGLSYKI